MNFSKVQKQGKNYSLVSGVRLVVNGGGQWLKAAQGQGNWEQTGSTSARGARCIGASTL